MIYNKYGKTYCYGGKVFTIGGTIKTNSESTYPGLYGCITEIRDEDDTETDNNTPDFYCSFYPPVLPHLIEQIAKKATELTGAPITVDELGLDQMIMAPEMLEPVPTAPLSMGGIPLYVVHEQWAIREADDQNEHIFLSEEEARMQLQKYVRDFEECDVGKWLDHPCFVEESTEDSYTCYLEDEYCSNHYTAEIQYRSVVPGLDFIHRIGAIDTEFYILEDIQSRMESDHPDITPEERKQILSYGDIRSRFSDKLDYRDTFWDIYWQAVDDVIADLTELVREESMDEV